MAGPTLVGFIFLKNALWVNAESQVNENPTYWLSSSNWSVRKAICTMDNAPPGFQKTRKSRASCLGSTMFSMVRSMECTCSGEAVKKAKGPMRCSAQEWQRWPPLFSFLLLCRDGLGKGGKGTIKNKNFPPRSAELLSQCQETLCYDSDTCRFVQTS